MRFQSFRLLLAIASVSSLLALSGCGDKSPGDSNDDCVTEADCTGDLICTDGECVPSKDPLGGDPVCGDGVLNSDELCDTAIPAGKPGACPTECPAQSACRPGKLFVDACDTECGFDKTIDAQIDGDGCCPIGADATTDTDCMETCGNGVLNDGEVCDDGLENGLTNKCAHDCQGITESICGNAVLEDGEDCDEGGESSTCNADCSPASCGDGIWNFTAGETCDDGDDNGEPLKCATDCSGTTAAVCGNGVIEAGETCDEAADNGEPNHCNADCDGTTAAICGNGIVEEDEVCDDGAANGDPLKCNTSCNGTAGAICGNGVIEAGETCDDGALNGSALKCNTTCSGTSSPVCGNSVQEPGEACDGGGFSADCNDDCSLSSCGDGIVNAAAGEACDDADENGDPLKCSATCGGITAAVCGNGIKEAGETCDAAGANGDPLKCNATCDGITAAVCGNGIKEAGETCDHAGENGDPLKCNATCSGITAPACGNGIEEAGEVCDDGALNGTPNKCNSTCSGTANAVCGNGTIEAGETCDDGAENGDPFKCNSTCNGISPPACGNSVQEPGEACDTGGFSTTCNDDCSLNACGDGIVNTAAGETCDDGANNGQPLKCSATCNGTTAPVCGNGIAEAGETCDDGSLNGQPNKCSTTCNGPTASVCGNSIIEAGETCDDGAQNGQPNKCSATCNGITAAFCGNGAIEAGETCDDGTLNGQPNKCNTICTGTTAAVCGNGIREGTETCDDGSDNGNPNKCNESCTGTTAAACGNGILEGTEACDDEGESATCNANCSVSVCGDSIVNTSAGEECDEGGATATCNADCTEPAQIATAFRIESAKIIDPHMYFAPLFTCADVTNAGVKVLGQMQLDGGVNKMLADAFADTADAPNDDLFKLSIAILMRPLTQTYNTSFDVDIAFPKCEKIQGPAGAVGDCFADVDDPTATPPHFATPNVMTQATNTPTAACLPASQQLGRRPTYTGLNNPTGECFVTQPTSVTITLAGIELALTDAKLVGKYSGTPATAITEGILMGFLPLSVAKAAEIDVPILGKKKVSDFLRGPGAGGCGNNNNTSDMDTHNGVDGWWFYLNYTAKKASSWTE